MNGRVQGVFYRASTLSKAQTLGLVGWVKNMSDGSVLVEAQGDAQKVGNLIDWCKEGPRMARVTEINTSDLKVNEDQEFNIRY